MTMFRSIICAIVCVLVMSFTVTGLSCFECKHILTSASFVDSLFNTRNENCKGHVDEFTEGVRRVTCPTPSSGKVAKCSHLNGTSKMELGIIDFSINFNVRGCVEESIGEPDVCDTKPNWEQSIDMLKSIISVAGLSVGTFDGETCVCSSDLCNSQSNLRSSTTWLMVLFLIAKLYT